jgi:muconate cycloisomerase
MKISRIKLFQISIPFAEPYRLSKVYGTLHHAQAVIVKIETDEGLAGLGEADPMMPFTEESPKSAMAVIRDVIAPDLIGQDPLKLNQLESNLDQLVNGYPTARGAINMALYDILGKSMNKPVYELLGGLRHEKLPLLLGISSLDLDDSIAAIEKLRSKGVNTVMLKMGELAIADEIRRFIGIREHYGDAIKLVVDANQGWEVFEALEFIQGINGYHLDLLEQPIERNNLAGLKEICERANCSLSADESLVEAEDAEVLIRQQVVNVFSIKVSKNGGLDKSKRIAHMAAGSGLKCLMNSMLEFGITQAASLHLGCTLPNLMDCGHAYGSVTRMADDVTDFDQNISKGFVTVPAKPGLGVVLDEDKLKKYSQEQLEIGGPAE